MSVKSIIDGWRELSLQDQIEVAKTILVEIDAIKRRRANEAQAGLRNLGGPHEHSQLMGQESTSKYRSMSDTGRTWAGLGEIPHWLLEEMEAGERSLADFKVR